MSKYDYSEVEQQINNVLAFQQKELATLVRPSTTEVNKRISESEALLKEIGYGKQISNLQSKKHPLISEPPRRVMVVPSWQSLCVEAEKCVGTSCRWGRMSKP